MFLGKDIIGNPVISVSDGRIIGRVKDVYLTPDCQSVVGLYLGSEGLFSRTAYLVKREDVTVLGPDAALVRHDQVIHEVADVAAAENWLRRDNLQGRDVDTAGGTKVGKIGDVILDKNGQTLGFSLSHTFVSGPIAENRAVAYHAVQDVGNEDGAMTIDLKQAEQQQLKIA